MLAALLAQQATQIPAVSAEVDHDEIAAGESVTLTIRIETRGTEPIEVSEPALTLLERRGFREQSQVSIQAGLTTRITTRQIQLAATDPGTATIGPVRVKQGDRFAETGELSIRVTPRPVDAAVALSPRVRAMLANMPPPDGIRNVALGIVASPTTVMVGAPVDVVVAAWFPREVRLQLRTPPSLTDPELRGAWVYPQPVPTGLAATRFVGGRWYDLYVLHSVVFPFSPGTLDIGRAKVAYALPLTYSFLSRELRHEVESDPVIVTVNDQPPAGRPSSFPGLVASNLRMQMEVAPRTVAVGEASTVTITLTGSGNVALWPEPKVRWPDDVRIYPGDTDVKTALENGRIAGTKRFTYLVVPDSAGVHAIRDVSVPYLDLDTRRYGELRAAAVDVVAGEVGGGGAPVAARPEPPALLEAGGDPLIPAFGLPPALLLGVVLGFPLIALALRGKAVARLVRRRPAATALRSLTDVHREFRLALERLVPQERAREGNELTEALRAAGVEATAAAHAAKIRDRLRQSMYGPGHPADDAELIAETQEILRALTGSIAAEGKAA